MKQTGRKTDKHSVRSGQESERCKTGNCRREYDDGADNGGGDNDTDNGGGDIHSDGDTDSDDDGGDSDGDTNNYNGDTGVILSVLTVVVILVVRITGRKRQTIVQEAINVSVFNP
jgi:hypothetical protein